MKRTLRPLLRSTDAAGSPPPSRGRGRVGGLLPLLALAALCLAACAPGGKLVVPQTPDEAYYAAEKGYEAALSFATDAAASGRLPPSVYRHQVRPKLIAIEQGLDAAWELLQARAPAGAALALVQRDLEALQKLLAPYRPALPAPTPENREPGAKP